MYTDTCLHVYRWKELFFNTTSVFQYIGAIFTRHVCMYTDTCLHVYRWKELFFNTTNVFQYIGAIFNRHVCMYADQRSYFYYKCFPVLLGMFASIQENLFSLVYLYIGAVFTRLTGFLE